MHSHDVCRKMDDGSFNFHIPLWRSGGTGDHTFNEVYCEPAYSQGHVYALSQRRCINGYDSHNYMFRYYEQFMDNYAKVPRFATLHVMNSHEPGQHTIKTLDKDLATLIKRVLTKYPDTAIFIVGDHGTAYGSYFSTNIGQLENKLPPMIASECSLYILFMF